MKIMLDECVTEAPAEALIMFFATEDPIVEAAFVPAYFGREGLKDSAWPLELKNRGEDWFVITADRDSARKNTEKRAVDGPPLYTVLPKLKMSAVFMSNGLSRAKGPEKVRAITYLWPEIKNFFETYPPGSRAHAAKFNKRFDFRPNY